MSRKVVGITMGLQPAKAGIPARHVLNRAYTNAVEMAGGLPILLPTLSDLSVIPEYLSRLDGLLLTGGADIEPSRYGQQPHPKLGETDPERDAFEIALVQQALAQDIPVFAICRGIQVVNVALGGTLYQHLPDECPSNIAHRQSDIGLARSDFSHTIEIKPTSRLASIVESSHISVNSHHHQAVREVAPGLEPVAWAPDGVIEALESPRHRFLLAVQFHPEETYPHDPPSQQLFAAFLKAL